MSTFTSTDQPGRSEPPHPHDASSERMDPHAEIDELTLAKLRLLAGHETGGQRDTGAPPMEAAQQMLRKHPLLAALGALLAGFVIMRFGVLRKIAIGGLFWGGKRLLTSYLRGRMGK